MEKDKGYPSFGAKDGVQFETHLVENIKTCQTASKNDPPSASNFDPLRACL
jgi:hypothetical protein